MKFFRIKWELIIAIAFGIQMIVGATILTDGILDYIAESFLVLAFISWLVVYKDFKKARKLLAQSWK